MADDPQPPASLDDDWCSIAEAARRLGVTETAIRNRIKRRTLETRPLGNHGRQVRVPKPVPLTRSEPVRDTGTPHVPVTVLDEMTTLLVEELRDRLAELQGRLTTVDAERINIRKELDQERAASAQERQQLQAAMIEAGSRLDRLQAERDADLALHRSEIDALQAELQRAVKQLQRPWWKRIIRAA